MPGVKVRFYGALNDFLLADRRARELEVPIDGTPAVKDVLESLGPPHPEIALVLVDGAPSPFTRRLNDGVRVAAYPAFHALPVPDEALATPRHPEPPRFVLDVHLGTLARHLRLLGLDAEWSAQAEDAALARRASEGRILLSRDLGALKRTLVVHGYWPRSDDPRTQLAEVVQRFALRPHARPFSRCLRCNGALVDASLADVAHAVPPRVREGQTEFRRCTGCSQIYWRGTHHAQLMALVESVLRER